MIATIPAKFRGRARRDAAAFYLTQLAKGILSGELALLSGQQQIMVATSEFVILEFEVKRRKRANRGGDHAAMARAPAHPGRGGAEESVNG